MKCPEVYLKDSLKDQWVRDNVEHDVIPDVEDQIVINRCIHCGGKMYPKDYA